MGTMMEYMSNLSKVKTMSTMLEGILVGQDMNQDLQTNNQHKES